MSSAVQPAPVVLLLPGWLDSGPVHWQSRWQQLHGYRRVEQADWLWPRRGDWMARLDEALLEQGGGVVVVAHSLGCQLLAAWAASSRWTGRVRGALLVAPPDTERSDMPPNLYTWRRIERGRLPFRSLVVASSDDPWCDPLRAAHMAADWGSEHVNVGAGGHLNEASGLGDWPAGHALLLGMLRDDSAADAAGMIDAARA